MERFEAVKCDQCGRLATVKSAAPVFDRSEAPQTPGSAASRASVVVECPQCGVRAQVIELDVS